MLESCTSADCVTGLIAFSSFGLSKLRQDGIEYKIGGQLLGFISHIPPTQNRSCTEYWYMKISLPRSCQSQACSSLGADKQHVQTESGKSNKAPHTHMKGLTKPSNALAALPEDRISLGFFLPKLVCGMITTRHNCRTQNPKAVRDGRAA